METFVIFIVVEGSAKIKVNQKEMFLIANECLIISCNSKESTPAKINKSGSAKLVKAQPVEVRTLVDRLELPGTIRAENVANILSTAEGKIAKLLVREGDAVRKDQVVVLISPLIREDIINSARLMVEARQEALSKNPFQTLD
ncbi:hypothetical protein B1H10_09075 [candidate division KSB1 bacterium 4484_188]|nr:MAG: hypothetical protein B1H10_09075 [candidate division KSB1 bacterium 4484_188]